MLQDLREGQGIDKCFCAQMREDPVVYINGEPCSVRNPDKLNEPADHLFSIDATELEAMEARLKRDIISHSGINRGHIEVYYQQPNMDNELNQVGVQEVHTMRETFDWLVAQGHQTLIPNPIATRNPNPDSDPYPDCPPRTRQSSRGGCGCCSEWPHPSGDTRDGFL